MHINGYRIYGAFICTCSSSGTHSQHSLQTKTKNKIPTSRVRQTSPRESPSEEISETSVAGNKLHIHICQRSFRNLIQDMPQRTERSTDPGGGIAPDAEMRQEMELGPTFNS